MRKRIVLVLLAMVAGCGAPFEESAKPEVMTPFDAEYRAASEELGVPFELLRGMGAAQSAHHRIDASRSESGQAGVMGLQPDAIAEASRLLGLPEETIANDDLANVRAAAALVADRRLRGETWNGAALAAAGITGEDLRARWLLKYAKHLKSAGELVPNDLVGAVGSAAAGEYPDAVWVPAYSGNYANGSRGLDDVTHVVIHDIEGSYEGAISWFQNPSSNVSAHYVIANEGDITQMVLEEDIGWHCGNWNSQTIGIEHEGYASDPNSYPETMYVSSAALTRYLTDKYSIPRTRDYIVGHVEVPGATHTDPGPYWEWDHYMDLVGGAVEATLVGYVREDDIFDGPGIPGATVALSNGRTATTDADGYYEIGELVPATYTVTASADGYETVVSDKAIEASGTWWKSVALTASPATGDDDDDVNPTSNKAHGGGNGCSVTATTSASGAFPLAALALLALALRRRK